MRLRCVGVTPVSLRSFAYCALCTFSLSLICIVALKLEIAALFQTSPDGRLSRGSWLALKPLFSHLRYASQVIPTRSHYLCPWGNYRPYQFGLFKAIRNSVTIPEGRGLTDPAPPLKQVVEHDCLIGEGKAGLFFFFFERHRNTRRSRWTCPI